MSTLEATGEWLRTTPLLGLFLTVGGYAVGRELHRRTGRHPVTQPVLIAMVLVAGLLWLADIDLATYRRGGDLVAFLLGPATVALAVPLHRQMHHVRRLVLPLLVGISVGAFVTISLGYLLVRALGGPEDLALTMAPKSATTPVSMALADQVGGLVPIAALLPIAAGILGAVAGPWLLSLLRVTDARIRGMAVGAVSHGIGTARVLADDETEGAFAGLAMGLTALATSVLLPVVLWIF